MKKPGSRLEKLEQAAKRLPPKMRKASKNVVAYTGIPLSAWIAFTEDLWRTTGCPWPPSDEEREARRIAATKLLEELEKDLRLGEYEQSPFGPIGQHVD